MRGVVHALLAVLAASACAPTADTASRSSVSGDDKQWACELLRQERSLHSLRASGQARLPRDLGLSRMSVPGAHSKDC